MDRKMDASSVETTVEPPLLWGIALYAFWRSLGTRDLFDVAAG
jgi:hypothetical protein